MLGDQRVLSQAFSDEVLNDGNNSRVIELNEDHFVVVNVVEHDLPHTKPLAQVRDVIKQQLTRRKTTQALQQKADAIMSAIEQGQSLQAVADARDLQWQQQREVTRSNRNVNRELMSHAFGMNAPDNGQTVDSVSLATGDVAVIVLESVVPGQMADFSETERMGLRAEIQRAMNRANSNDFVSSLREKADIEML